jgi:hypothetical protein
MGFILLYCLNNYYNVFKSICQPIFFIIPTSGEAVWLNFSLKNICFGNGFLAYQKLENNIHSYYGRSYWGEKTSYFFSADFNRINIQAPDGVLYVYEKTTAPRQHRRIAEIAGTLHPAKK